jgi:hypothetical protein
VIDILLRGSLNLVIFCLWLSVVELLRWLLRLLSFATVEAEVQQLTIEEADKWEHNDWTFGCDMLIVKGTCPYAIKNRLFLHFLIHFACPDFCTDHSKSELHCYTRWPTDL